MIVERTRSLRQLTEGKTFDPGRLWVRSQIADEEGEKNEDVDGREKTKKGAVQSKVGVTE